MLDRSLVRPMKNWRVTASSPRRDDWFADNNNEVEFRKNYIKKIQKFIQW